MAIAQSVIGPGNTTVATNTTVGMSTSTMMGGLTATNAVFGAFSAYQAGKMRQMAYDHEAAMAEINAKQIEIVGMFDIADRTNELANTLALQNVMSAASGRSGGSIQALQRTSEANLEKDIKRIKTTGRARQVATLMSGESKRIVGKTAAQQGLLSGVTDLTTGLAKASQYIK